MDETLAIPTKIHNPENIHGKIKILRIITRLNIGGPARHAMILTQGLNNDQFKSYLVIGKAEPNEGDMSYLYREHNVHPLIILELRRKISLIEDVIALWKLFRIIRRLRPDIVHTHMSKAGILGRLAARMAGIPKIVHTYHGHVFDGYFGSFGSRFVLLTNKLLASMTDRIIAISEEVQKEIVQKYRLAPENKVETIRLGLDTRPYIDIDRCRGRLRSELSFQDDEILISFVGRLVPIKNCLMLLKVAKVIIDKYDSVRFLIVGDGELRGQLEKEVQKIGLIGKVVFLGWRKDLNIIYADSDLVVLTSLNEGTPVSLIEAMLAGRAVVATDVGGVRDVVRDGVTGFVVRANDVSGFADKIFLLIQNKKLRSEMELTAKKLAYENYNSNRLVEETGHMYLRLLGIK